jgi:hypothetical protein
LIATFFLFHPRFSQLDNPQVRAALGLGPVDEAIYLQMQQEQRREMQLQQMLLQERLAQESMLHEQQLKALGEHIPDLQQHYSRLLLGDQLQRAGGDERLLVSERLRIEEELRRRQLLLQQQQHQHQQRFPPQLTHQHQHAAPRPSPPQLKQPPISPPVAAPVGSKVQPMNQSMLRDIAADSLAGNAVRRGEVDKRKFAKPDADATAAAAAAATAAAAGTGQHPKKRARSNTNESTELEMPQSPLQHNQHHHHKHKKPKKEKKSKKQDQGHRTPRKGSEANKEKNSKPQAQDLLDFASSSMPKKRKSNRGAKHRGRTPSPSSPVPESFPPTPRGTLGDLIDAARNEGQSDDAITVLVSIKKNVEWSDSEDEMKEEEGVYTEVEESGDCIELPNFISVLPRLPVEPSLEIPDPCSKMKRKGLLDDDSVEETPPDKRNAEKSPKAPKNGESKGSDQVILDLPYQIDTWWPSTASIKRERKALGNDEDSDDNSEVLGDEGQFRANLDWIKEKLASDIQPGVLEKIPHCKIHRMLMKKKKNPSAPEFVYCWQVTELYPNDIMVCCSHCGTWRHTACGGHYKPYSVKEAIEKPFEALCDRCYEEENFLEDYPVARKRLDRQRCEQMRRALATSATMRQASFSKHGGTYKWPLGSVSATHIGGHTRSVHSRHDKAEKQWTDMATKLSRGYGYRPKERVKHRTKELERLLVSVEDAGMYFLNDFC